MPIVDTVDITPTRVRFGNANAANGGDFDTNARFMRKVFTPGASSFQAAQGPAFNIVNNSGLQFHFKLGGYSLSSGAAAPSNTTVLVAL